jgi:cellulose synthase operon protein C
VTSGKILARLGAAALVGALALSAQTLEQAEALRKAHRYVDANEVFRFLVDQNPKNADYRERWGRLYMEVGQEDEAGKLFTEALEVNKNHARALLGLAQIADETYDNNAGELAHKALETDPKLVEAQEMLARLALENNNNSEAVAEAKKALAMNANAEQAKAILAIMDWLADKKDTTWDPHTAGGYATAGFFLTLNRRYDEAIAYYRKALELDPGFNRARSELGIDLMRMGQDQEAYQQLETAFNNGFRDKPTKNSLKLMDSYKNFVTFRTDRTILKLQKGEAELLRPYFESEMERAISTYEKKYGVKLDRPVQVEVYPNHTDFEVRTLGVPGLGALGVTFGYAIAMDSPSARGPGSFHWDSTLWHEMSHVFTLTMTNHRVPRWFTEGVAVHEETAASPEWGDRLGLDEIAAIRSHQLLPVAELDRGFIHPTRPQQVIVSYFQAGKICDYITERWGWNTILAMLKDFGNDEDTAAVVRKELKMEPGEFDQQFYAHLETELKPTLDHFDEWKLRVKAVADLFSKKDWDGVIKDGTAIRDYYRDYVEDQSVYEMLAQAYLAKDNKTAAIDELERYAKQGGRNPETLKLDAKLLAEAGNKKEAATVLDRLNYIYPMDNQAHQQLGELWIELGNGSGAAREFHSVLAHNPIDAARAHYDLARAYQLNHQNDKAKDEVLSALETAPGYRQAQKLLLELSGEQPEPAKGPNQTPIKQ